jgi:hypothetical protein
MGAAGAAGLGHEKAVLRETLAYGLCALELELQQRQTQDRKALVAEVRFECAGLLRAQCVAGAPNAAGLLPPPGGQAAPSQFDTSYALLANGEQLRSVKTQAFLHFKELTGLDSDILVGRGSNLASLVFYVAVHATAFGAASPDLQTRHRLQQAARESCRFLETVLRDSLAPGVSSPTVPAARLEAHASPGLTAI